jgi:hypothetical protein
MSATVSRNKAAMPTGDDLVGLEGLAYIAFEKTEQLRHHLEAAAENQEWATAEEAWLLTFAADGLEDRAAAIESEAKKLKRVAHDLYLGALDAGKVSHDEYPDQIKVTTAILERIAAERRVDFPDRFEEDSPDV